MTTRNYGYLKSVDDLRKLVAALTQAEGPIGFDVETGYSGPDRVKGSLFPEAGSFIVGFSITNNPKWARYVPLRHDLGPNLNPDDVFELIKPLLESGRAIAHNAKFEKRMLRTEGIEMPIPHDTMLAAYCLSEWKAFGLKDLVEWIFGHKMATIKSLFPDMTEKQQACMRFNRLALTPDVVSYACEDAAWCLALYDRLCPRAQENFAALYKVEHEIAEIMADVEDWGVAVDWEAMEAAREEGLQFAPLYEKEVRELFAEQLGRSISTLNFGSTQQLRSLLYDPPPNGLGIRPTRMTKGGKTNNPQPSTDAIALKTLSKKNVAVRKLLEWREIQNLSKRFIKWLDQFRIAEDDRVHANYGQVIVPTGRFNASDPPIQQCPKQWRWAIGDWGDLFEPEVWTKVLAETEAQERFYGNFRDFIVSAPGSYFLSYDYSQIELRVMAGLSKEQALLDAFNESKDVHTITASMMLGKPTSEISEQDRAIGKTMNFALLYGMGVRSLADRLGKTLDEAKALYASYFSGFASINSWMEQCKTEARQRGHTISWFGRKATVWEFESLEKGLRAKGERAAVNYPVQGGAADYMKVAMIRCARVLKKKEWWGTKVKMVMNHHDALTFEVTNDIHPFELRDLLRPVVEFPVQGFPVIVSDWELAQKWGSGVKLKSDTVIEFDGEKWCEAQGVQKAKEPDPEPDVTPIEVPDTPAELVETPKRRTLVVEVVEMPTDVTFQRLLDLINHNPGDNVVCLKTPDGELLLDQVPTSLDIEDQPRFSLALNGATVYHPHDEVDTTTLASGLSL